MPRLYEMTYEGHPHYRWSKMHKGIRYRVTCADLGAKLFTKEATGKLANEWWRRKVDEIEGRSKARTDFLTSLHGDSQRQSELKIRELEQKLRYQNHVIEALRVEIVEKAAIAQTEAHRNGTAAEGNRSRLG